MDQGIVSSVRLKNGEWASLGAVEVTAIPHFSILNGEYTSMEDAITQYQAEFLNVLNDFFQSFKSSGFRKTASVELLWKSLPVQNQPYRAEIRFYLIVRCIEAQRVDSEREVLRQLQNLNASLSLLKYDFETLKTQNHGSIMAEVDDTGIRAVVKEETAENLQNAVMPYCYAYNRFPVSHGDLKGIVKTLTSHPNAAVSFQLMPTAFQAEEAEMLDQNVQTLETLRRGVMEQGIGSISFALAERHADNYKYYAERKNTPLFLYNILVYAESAAVESIAGRVFSELAGVGDERANLKMITLRKEDVRKDSNYYPLPWAINGLIMGRERNMTLWNSGFFPRAMQRLPYIISGEEAVTFFRLPIGSSEIQAGLRVNEAGKDTKTYSSNLINAGDITVGKLKSASDGATIGFSLSDLAKHMLVVGTPGSGKTTFSVGMLDRLWKDHGIPFLVIEPAKNEYRALVESIPDLQVFTPGKNFISPFVFNPFVPPKNVRLETYKSTLKTAFSAGVSMTTPLDKIFEETINNCYSDFRWLDSYTVEDGGQIFNIADFIRCFQNTFQEIGYTGDARNIGRAGVVRLKSLVNLFDNYHSIPIEELLSKPTVIELAAIENADQKALIIALLLLSILSYVNRNYTGEGGLKNVILLEEAHVLLDPATNAGQGDANPSAVAQSLVKRMLAEIRSYGVGVVIADQSPRKVTADVVALTDMKVVFRLVENDDKQIIGNSTGMSDYQIRRLAKLKPGEAFLFFNKLEEPEEVVTPDYRLEKKIHISLSDESIAEKTTYWKGREQLLRPYPQCQFCDGCRNACDYEHRLLGREIARRLFNRYIKTDAADKECLRAVFPKLSSLVKAELNQEPFSVDLVRCVRVHLLRKIRYETKIRISDQTMGTVIRG